MAAAVVAAKKKKKIMVVPEEAFKLDEDPHQNLPIKAHRLKEGMLQKKTLSAYGTTWVNKTVVLCHDKLALCNEGSDRLSEYIPLYEIVSVKKLMTEQSGALLSNKEEKKPQGKKILQSVIGRNGPAMQHLEEAPKWSQDGNLKPKLEITTIVDGHNGGRRYILQSDTDAERDSWVSTIQKEAEKAVERKKSFEESQMRTSLQGFLRWIHDSAFFQALFTLIILLMFVNSVAIAELPDGQRKETLEWVDRGFTIAFAVELLVNMGAMWFWEFWTGDEWAWNWFDFILISVSLPLSFVVWNSSITALRLIRIFRIVKLFHKIKALNRILTALASSLLPVANAFIILLVISAIYAIIGVELFGDKSPDQFGDFSSALFTMFQVMTGDAWSTDVARPLFDISTHPLPEVALFFVSYLVIAGIFVLNVVIAVLLDAFLEQLEHDKQLERDQEQKAILDATIRRGTSIDPLLLSLSNFSSMEDLKDKIHDIFKVLDTGKNGLLTFEELSQGLQKLNVEPKIRFSEENFDIITENRKKCVGPNNDEIDEKTFTDIITVRLKQFMKRYIGERMVPVCRDDMKTETVLFMLKTLMFSDSEKVEQPRGGQMEARISKIEGEVSNISSKLDLLLQRDCNPTAALASLPGTPDRKARRSLAVEDLSTDEEI